MVRKILDSKDKLLRKVSSPVGKIDKKVRGTITDLQDTLRAQKDPEGVGLAAPQIGKSFRIFVMLDRNLLRTIINPQILEISQKRSSGKKGKAKNLMEGCLSLPNYYSPLSRANWLKLKFTDVEGKTTIEEFTGFPAQIIQHEVDHLNGKLFLDRLLEQKKSLYKLSHDGWDKVDLDI
jgi:peptide deformylase